MSSKLNVLDHDMVPQHLIMSEEEVTELFSRYDISSDHLPKIFHDDPAVKTISGKPGDVIRIIRKSHTAGEALSYRYVIRRPKK